MEIIKNLSAMFPIIFVSILIILSIVAISTGNSLVGLITLVISIVLGIAFLSELLNIIAGF